MNANVALAAAEGIAPKLQSSLLTMTLCLSLIVATYAIVRLLDIAAPRTHGHTHPAVKILGGVGILVIVVLTVFLVMAAISAFGTPA